MLYTRWFSLSNPAFKMYSSFIQKDVESIVCSSSLTKNKLEVQEYLSWLQSTPKITSYRVNVLCADVSNLIEKIQCHLEKQRVKNGWKTIPRVYQHFPDTVGIEPWPKENGVDTDIDDNLPKVIVDAPCGAAVLRGANVFAPAVMGLPPDIRINDDINIYADTSGGCKQGSKSDYNGVKILVGRGKLKMSRHQLFGENIKPRGVAVETIMPVSRVPVIEHDVLPLGSCLLQNLPSIICSKVLNPQPEEVILDMCAAPGNKTTHLAEIMNDNGIIIALDKIADKINIIKQKCKESSITCVHAFAFDSTKAVTEDNNSIKSNVLCGPPFSPESFDRILLDVPCSALGQRPSLRNKITVKMLRSYVPLQRKLFYAAVKMLKSGATMVYSTCTTTKEECEGMVSWALTTFPSLTLLPAEPIYGGPGYPDSGLNDEQRLMVQRFGPEEDSLRISDPVYRDTIGFFIALFSKQ